MLLSLIAVSNPSPCPVQNSKFCNQLEIQRFGKENFLQTVFVRAVIGLKFAVLEASGVSVRLSLLSGMPFLIFGSLLNKKW